MSDDLERMISAVVATGAGVKFTRSEHDGRFYVSVELPGANKTFVGTSPSAQHALKTASANYEDYLAKHTGDQSSAIATTLNFIGLVVELDESVYGEAPHYKFEGPLATNWASFFPDSRTPATDRLFMDRLLAYVIDSVSPEAAVSYRRLLEGFEIVIDEGMDQVRQEITFRREDPLRYLYGIQAIAVAYLRWMGWGQGAE